MEGMTKVAMVLWVLAALTYLAGVIALSQGGAYLGAHVATWHWNALILGVLALGAKKVLA